MPRVTRRRPLPPPRPAAPRRSPRRPGAGATARRTASSFEDVKSPALAILGAALLGAGGPPAAAAAACSVLNYTFQPDCFRSAGSDGCAFDENHPDFGPQIAVWVGSADGS